MIYGNKLGKILLSSVVATTLVVGGSIAASAANVSKSKIQDHKTTPAGKYQPQMDSVKGGKQIKTEGSPELSADEYKTATKIYFERCAGCHGVLRKGATGKPLTTKITLEHGGIL